MKLLLAFMLLAFTAQSQTAYELNNKWRMDKNKYITGGLVFLGGAAKGFNETLQFHWKSFHARFPKANPNWFNPAVSWRNKYENDDPNKSAKFPLSTSVLVFLTDQYHLNNFINRGAITAALVIKIGEKKKRFSYYVKDFLFYTACYQAGWSLTYLPFKYKKQ
jgi:hypothetical protein